MSKKKWNKKTKVLSQLLLRAEKSFPSLLYSSFAAPERFYELKQSVSQEVLERKRETTKPGPYFHLV